MSRPIGQKAAKRKNKGKECHNTLDLSSIESIMKDKNVKGGTGKASTRTRMVYGV